ncbi:MAG: T9SS type A sorting domain-containing protein [Bacteroidetes bacterium]|nr:T9SS type A sorting domain-containing protein [Bacteroidota bacterium]MBL6944038.1 T9SS type A sorting domain-containing protein [Bacteroidales bacterium]
MTPKEKGFKSNIFLIILISLIIGSINSLSAQYAPSYRQSTTTAIHADSNVFVDWANKCIVSRGWIDISMPEYGWVTYGIEDYGLAKADNAVVSLGDGGGVVLNFNTPIADGQGWDFAVFENSFSHDFLELAFVEVSSNGVDYYRFNSISLTQQDTQVGTFGLIDTAMIYNLAGKYRALYGVPFDLSELKYISGLDLTNIISVRIIDVVGSIDSNFASYDSEGRIINDPWPTPFESGGFDLDAVGVIHNRDNTSVNEIVKNASGIIYPNPVGNYFMISEKEKINKVSITDMSGKLILEYAFPDNNYFDAQFLPAGLYIVNIYCEEKLLNDMLIKH